MPQYEAAVVEAGRPVLSETFYARHYEKLGELFAIHGVPAEALDSLESAVTSTQPWVREHIDDDLDGLTLAQSQAAHALYHEIGMVEEIRPPAGHFAQVVVSGAMQRGNNRRMGLGARTLQRPDISTDKLVLLSGQRPKNPDKEKVPIEENLESIKNSGLADAWAQRVIHAPERLRWETDLLRLAAADHLGPLVLRQLHLRLLQNDPIERYELEVTRTGLPVALVHSLPVSRAGLAARPTTRSCVRDWIATVPPPEGARVAFISGNPHIERMTRTARAELKDLGRDDIELIGAGSAVAPGQGHQIFKGEIARNLYEDLQATAA